MQYLSTNRAARRVQARAGAVTSNRSRRMKMKTNKIRSWKSMAYQSQYSAYAEDARASAVGTTLHTGG